MGEASAFPIPLTPTVASEEDELPAKSEEGVREDAFFVPTRVDRQRLPA